MKLTAENVNTVFMDCLFKDGEDTSKAVIAEGVVSKYGFNPSKLESHKQDIADLLFGLSENFKTEKGGGWSFLQACMTKNDEQWGEHLSVEKLMVLGLATKQVKMSLPREFWSQLPGGMPYFAIL